MIVAFNPSLNFDKMVIFRSFQQSATELYDLSHFGQEHVLFFDQVTIRQLKDTATAVLLEKNARVLQKCFV